MCFVPVKNCEQQAVLALHRVRQSFIKARTAQANQIRGLVGESGLILPQGIANIGKRIPELIEDASNELPGSFRLLVDRLLAHLKELDRQVGELETRIKIWHKESELSRRLEKVPGIGPITASALVATVGDAKSYDNARQLATWMGLVPKQNSIGGKSVLLGISKRSDTYLRTLLIRGARAAILAAQRKANKDDNSWLGKLLQRRHPNVAAGALANKNARTVWALLARDREFRPDYAPARAVAWPRRHRQESTHTNSRRSHHRLLRRPRHDGKTGKTVVDKAREVPRTQSAHQ